MQVNVNFKVTESASKEMKKALEESNLSDHVVRVSVEAGGCSGFMYGLGFEEKNQIQTDDIVENYGDVTVVIDKKSILFLDGATVDWVEDLNQRGFKFINPNATKSCGCGKSFQ
jgi:iron-sulfur cluster assembly protein